MLPGQREACQGLWTLMLSVQGIAGPTRAAAGQRRGCCTGRADGGLLLAESLLWSKKGDLADPTSARQGEGAEGVLGVRAGGRLLAESQLRQLVTPDQWCAHEAMRAGRVRLAAAGVAKHERLAALPPERLRVAAEQLAPAPVRSPLCFDSHDWLYRRIQRCKRCLLPSQLLTSLLLRSSIKACPDLGQWLVPDTRLGQPVKS